MSTLTVHEYRFSRREVLAMGGAAVLGAALFGLGINPAHADPKETKDRLSALTGGKELEEGKIVITLPELTQDGKRTRLKVAVDSPMSDADYVKSVHILAERNTVPDVASYHFTPLSGKAEITMRIRVAKSQTIIVAAEMSDGRCYVAKARCNVARGAGGCG